MKRGSVYIFSKCAWVVEEVKDGHTRLTLLAGPDGQAHEMSVPNIFLSGRPMYHRAAEVDDVDASLAAATVRTTVDPAALSNSPRAWASAFSDRYTGKVTPDLTIMLGWFANAMTQAVLPVQSDLDKMKAKKTVRKPTPPRGGLPHSWGSATIQGDATPVKPKAPKAPKPSRGKK